MEFESISRPALARVYANAGHFLSIVPLDEWSARLIENFLSGFHLTRVADSSVIPSSSSYSIRIRFTENLPSIPPAVTSFEIEHGRCHQVGSNLYLAIEDSLIVVPQGGEMDIWVGASEHARQSASLMNLMAYCLEIALRRCGLYELHGAGVLEPSHNWGALILGASGSGKSTLASLLAVDGWNYLTDDTLLLEDLDGTIEARGLRKAFALSEKTLDAIGTPQISSGLRNQVSSDPSKRRVEPKFAFPDRWVNSCVPQALLFASITHDPVSNVKRMRSSDAMIRLIKFNPWASYDKVTGPDHLQVLNRLTNQCRAYSLQAGIDILNDPAAARRLLMPLIEST
ncbi:MAG TPA: hypothetical protein VJU86_03930 [Pyrinomonadaceae bacterium]|nr:hypothetical protein [Pyrinomonadaceae bacterium]